MTENRSSALEKSEAIFLEFLHDRPHISNIYAPALAKPEYFRINSKICKCQPIFQQIMVLEEELLRVGVTLSFQQLVKCITLCPILYQLAVVFL